jgi:glycosyltransferase involved in cell wall biosynthesis
MKVLMTVDAVGGIWRYAMDLGTALAPRGVEVVFAGLGPRPSAAQVAAAPGEVVWGAAPLDWMAADADALTGVAPWLAGLAGRHRADVIQLNMPTQGAGLAPGVAVVSVCHSCLPTWFRAVEDRTPPPEFAWHADLARRGFARSRAVVAPSAAHAAAVASVHGLHGVAVVPNAAAVALAAPGGGEGIVAVGRWWDRGKNGAVLAAAAGATTQSVTLVGALEGPDGQCLAPGGARTTGPLPHDEAVRRVAAAAIFVSPSLYEPFGLAALEAARLGRPLVLADIPTYRGIWDGAAAFFDPRDARSLAALLDRLSADPDRRHAMGAAAQDRAVRFSPAAQAAAMTEIYRRTAALQPAE